MGNDPPPPPLTYEQAARVLGKLATLEHPVVLVGGQALNFWAGYYADQVAALDAGAPYTSKDIDFIGSKKAVKECAERLGGKPVLTSIDDANSPTTGIVLFVDDDGHTRQIDFLDRVAGQESRETYEASTNAHILDDHGNVIAVLRVMDPLSCLKSRTHNVARLPGYGGEHALNQLRASILCAKAFGLDLLAEDPFVALDYNQAVIKLAHGVGVEVYQRHRIDVFAALVDEPGLPEKFYTERLPRVHETLKTARRKAAAAAHRAAAIAAKTTAQMVPLSCSGLGGCCHPAAT